MKLWVRLWHWTLCVNKQMNPWRRTVLHNTQHPSDQHHLHCASSTQWRSLWRHDFVSLSIAIKYMLQTQPYSSLWVQLAQHTVWQDVKLFPGTVLCCWCGMALTCHCTCGLILGDVLRLQTSSVAGRKGKTAVCICVLFLTKWFCCEKRETVGRMPYFTTVISATANPDPQKLNVPWLCDQHSSLHTKLRIRGVAYKCLNLNSMVLMDNNAAVYKKWMKSSTTPKISCSNPMKRPRSTLASSAGRAAWICLLFWRSCSSILTRLSVL